MRAVLLGSALLAASTAWAQAGVDGGVASADAAASIAPRGFALDAGTSTPAPPVFSVKVGFGKGITVSRDESLSLTVKGRLSARDVVTVSGSTAANELSLRTARLIVQGKALSPSLTYTIQLALGAADFETGIASPVFDAYLDYTGWRDLQLRVGQFLVPLDRARTIRELSLQFVDRQQVVSELNLDRDIGLLAYSNDFLGLGGRLAYSLGVFGGQGKNRFTPVKNPVFLWVGRVTVRPMGPFDDDSEGDLERSRVPHLAIGVGAAYNGHTTRQRSTTGNVLTFGGFDYAHLAADAVFKYRGFSFLAEVLYRKADRDFREGTTGSQTVREYSRSGWGYTVQAGYLLTDMLELVARWNQLRTLGATDPTLIQTVFSQGKELSAGVNLYLNRHLFKVQADYTARFGEGPAPTSHFARVLVDLSF